MSQTHLQYRIERNRRQGWELLCTTSGGSARRPSMGRNPTTVAARAAGTSAEADHSFRRWLSQQHPALAEQLAKPETTLARATIADADGSQLVVVAMLIIE